MLFYGEFSPCSHAGKSFCWAGCTTSPPPSPGIPISLKRQQRKPSKPATPKGQSWKDFLKNHRPVMASMDFKVTFDWRGKLLYILNIIDHDRRELVVCRATHNPSSDWVAQQIRDAYPFDEAPKMRLKVGTATCHKLPKKGKSAVRRN